MDDDVLKPGESRAAALVSIVKDLGALLRDGALFFLGILLIVFPTKFNALLVSAGFEEGSVVGFKWKSKLVESDEALQKAQETISALQSKNDELVAALADTKGHSTDVKLDARIGKLEDDNRRLKDRTQQVQASVSQTIDSNAPLVHKALSATAGRTDESRSRSDYMVGLQTLGVPDEERAALNEKLRAQGFGLDATTWSYASGDRPPWFAARPTVFCYSSAALPMARELAGIMQSLTGREFAVQKGAGLGVNPARRDVTLFVHYLKP